MASGIPRPSQIQMRLTGEFGSVGRIRACLKPQKPHESNNCRVQPVTNQSAHSAPASPANLKWICQMPASCQSCSRRRQGLAGLPQSKRRTHLEAWLEVELQARFSGRILPIDAAVADRWGVLAADAKRKGKALSTIDAWLAATALHYNLTVVSRNVSDFANTQVPVLSPWEA